MRRFVARYGRWRVLAGLVPVAGAIAAACAIIWQPARPPSVVSAAAYHRVEVGMSRQEVEQAIGRPPGDYSGPDGPDPYLFQVESIVDVDTDARGYLQLPTGLVGARWVGREATVEVEFDRAGKARAKSLSVPVYPTWRDRLNQFKGWVRSLVR